MRVGTLSYLQLTTLSGQPVCREPDTLIVATELAGFVSAIEQNHPLQFAFPIFGKGGTRRFQRPASCTSNAFTPDSSRM